MESKHGMSPLALKDYDSRAKKCRSVFKINANSTDVELNKLVMDWVKENGFSDSLRSHYKRASRLYRDFLKERKM